MTTSEFSNQFDVLYNNITSNQAPGLDEYEKSVFLTKALDEIVKNYFSKQSKGNNLQVGFDESSKRQMDFSELIRSYYSEPLINNEERCNFSHYNSAVFYFPDDALAVINETLFLDTLFKDITRLVVPLSNEEFKRLMNKPYNQPLKWLVWRLITYGYGEKMPRAEIIFNSSDYKKYYKKADENIKYTVRYVKKPLPIILEELSSSGLSINGYVGSDNNNKPIKFNGANPATKGLECELNENLHEDILQRAVELAKIAWTSNDALTVLLETQAGLRSE